MKHFVWATLLILAVGLPLCTANAVAQLRTTSQQEPRIDTRGAMTTNDESWLSQLFDASHFSMHQSYSMSMSTSAVGSYGLSMFTNTFQFHPSDNLFIAADLSAVYSPFNSFGSAFSKQVNGVYLTNARLDYKFSDNTFLHVEYNGAPQAYGSPYSSPLFSGYSRYDFGNPFSDFVGHGGF